MAGGRICVGVIRGAFGVRGEVRLASFTEDPAAITRYEDIGTETGDRCFRLTAWRPIKDGFAARLDGVATREEAAEFRNTRLYIDRACLPEPGEEEYYHADLIGLAAVGDDGARLGEVTAVHDFGAGDLLEVTPCGGGQTILVPFTRQAVPRIEADHLVLAEPDPEG